MYYDLVLCVYLGVGNVLACDRVVYSNASKFKRAMHGARRFTKEKYTQDEEE